MCEWAQDYVPSHGPGNATYEYFMKPNEKSKVRRQIRSRQKMRRMPNAAKRLFTWESRLTTSADDGTGLFMVVGGHDVLVRERKNKLPVTGGIVFAGSVRELRSEVAAMLNRFVPRWLAQSPAERSRNMLIAARTARQCGWSI